MVLVLFFCFLFVALIKNPYKDEKKGLLFLLASAFCLVVNAVTPIIVVRTGGVPELGEPTNPRSIECEVTASIDGQVLTVQFSELTASQIVVRDSADNTVFDQVYVPAYSVQETLVSLSAGNYTLYIYAMGDWWYGQFEIE